MQPSPLAKLSSALYFLSNYVVRSTAAKPEIITGKEAAPLKWFIFREDCFDTFFNKMDFTNMECIKYTISKGLGYGIICGSAILKVPQIVKILSSKSVEGISKFLFYLEVRIIHSFICNYRSLCI